MREANTGINPAPLLSPIQYNEMKLAVIAERKEYFPTEEELSFKKIEMRGTNPIQAKKPR